MTWEPGQRYKIIYTTGTGDTTIRVIDVLSYVLSREGVGYLRAFCHLREEERTFREDRVDHAEEFIVDPSPSAPAERPQPETPPAMQSSPYAWANRPDTGMNIPWPQSEQKPKPTPPPPIQPPPPPESIADSPYAWANRPDPPAKPETGSRSEEVKNTGSSDSFSLGRAILSLLFIAGFRVLLDPPDYWKPSYSSVPKPPIFRPIPVAPKPVPRPTPRPAPTPQPKTVLNVSMIGGHRLLTTSTYGVRRYEVPGLGIVTDNRVAAVAAIRIPQFTRRTGISDPTLLRLYLEADLDGSGRLSFEELEAFQKKTFRQFKYLHNDTALRPDHFVAQGGGDCEDFALYTAGLLRFWGWEPYIACFGPPNDPQTTHAVCFSYEAGTFPSTYLYYQLTGHTTFYGHPLKNGNYVPIDYAYVGRFSNAVGPEWELRTVYIPEKIYGLTM